MKDIREGDLHKTVVIEDTLFEIRYGYTCEEERNRWEPVPLYPDFVKTPKYTGDGAPFATVYQDACRYYCPTPSATGENWCGDCQYFDAREEYIGICRCEKKKHLVTARKYIADAQMPPPHRQGGTEVTLPERLNFMYIGTDPEKE